MNQALRSIYRFCGSLKLAVIVITSLAGTLAYATFYESMYGTKAVQAAVYRSWWFAAILLFLGINIFCSAAQRYPWKKHQTGFVVAHTGILLVLFGSLITRQFGIDGTMPLIEGETSNIVSIDEPQFEIWDVTNTRWVSRGLIDVNKLKPRAPGETREINLRGIEEAGLKILVNEALDRSQPVTVFEEATGENAANETPAVLVEIFSPTNGIRSSQWFKANHPEFGRQIMGLAEVSFAHGTAPDAFKKSGSTKDPHGGGSNPNTLQLLSDSRGVIRYAVSSSRLGRRTGIIKPGDEIETGWRDFKFKILELRRHATVAFEYQPIPEAQAGNSDFPSALKLTAVSHKTGNTTQSRWLGFGDSVELTLGQNKYLLRFGPRLIAVPFAIKLHKFELGKYPGTDRAMTYASRVQLLDPAAKINRPEYISMNEPLDYKNFTFYQASYQETPQGIVSVFSVGRDPGRVPKYLGSLLVVLGTIIMYTHKTIKRRREESGATA